MSTWQPCSKLCSRWPAIVLANRISSCLVSCQSMCLCIAQSCGDGAAHTGHSVSSCLHLPLWQRASLRTWCKPLLKVSHSMFTKSYINLRKKIKLWRLNSLKNTLDIRVGFTLTIWFNNLNGFETNTALRTFLLIRLDSNKFNKANQYNAILVK